MVINYKSWRHSFKMILIGVAIGFTVSTIAFHLLRHYFPPQTQEVRGKTHRVESTAYYFETDKVSDRLSKAQKKIDDCHKNGQFVTNVSRDELKMRLIVHCASIN